MWFKLRVESCSESTKQSSVFSQNPTRKAGQKTQKIQSDEDFPGSGIEQPVTHLRVIRVYRLFPIVDNFQFSMATTTRFSRRCVLKRWKGNFVDFSSTKVKSQFRIKRLSASEGLETFRAVASA